jgi:hypothetical protein
MGRQYRQGDVLTDAVDAIPADAVVVPREGGQIVLAYGEVTGHRHAILDRHAELLTLPDAEIEQRFLRIVDADAALVHEEHATVTVPPGTYAVYRQREYAPPPVVGIPGPDALSAHVWFREVAD